MRRAADSGSSCSQTRMTLHPALPRRASVSRSRLTFAASLSLHHAAFDLGAEPCSGQPCQKHPSTKTATRARVKTRSARRRSPGIGWQSTRYRSPSPCTRRRMIISGAVSRRLWLSIRRRMTSDDAGGLDALEPLPIQRGRATNHLIVMVVIARRRRRWHGQNVDGAAVV